MPHVGTVALSIVLLLCTSFALLQLLDWDVDLRSVQAVLSLGDWRQHDTAAQHPRIRLQWHAPRKSWINILDQVLDDAGTHGFVFNGSQLPSGASYRTYNWCNMPHVRAQEYARPPSRFQLLYVEVIHRHHKRTPYAFNTFSKESYSWTCDDEALFYYGQPLGTNRNESSTTYWNVYTSDSNPFSRPGFAGTCQFPQITKEGLDDSWQHGKDLYEVYHDVLGFLPPIPDERVIFRVTNNQITSQVAGMLISGMYAPKTAIPLHVQPPEIDSLEPQYPCPRAVSLYASYSIGSTARNWTHHLKAAKPLFATLDAVSGLAANYTDDWHTSFDHYFDTLSARQCHAKPLPCNTTTTTTTKCIQQQHADTIYRLGQYEYSFIYRDSPRSLQAAVGSYGVFLAELAQSIRNAVERRDAVLYRHNVAHDGSVARLLSILQVEEMVWPGMGAEVVFEVYAAGDGDAGEEESASPSSSSFSSQGRRRQEQHYIRVLWGGEVLRSSHPSLGAMDMLRLDVFLGYVDGLMGRKAEEVVRFCASEKDHG